MINSQQVAAAIGHLAISLADESKKKGRDAEAIRFIGLAQGIFDLATAISKESVVAPKQLQRSLPGSSQTILVAKANGAIGRSG